MNSPCRRTRQALHLTSPLRGLLVLLLVYALLLAYGGTAHAAPGAIWTTRADCGTEQQNVNHYSIGETVYVNGANFNPGSYSWHIHGLPGHASLDPGITVASGTIQVGEAGTFCFPAYVVAGDDGGEYQVEVGGKHDNYRVEAAPPPPPTIAPPPPPTNTPVPPAPTQTPIIAPPPPPATNTPVPPAPTQTPIIAPPPPPATNTPVPPAPTQTPIIAPPPPPATNTPVPPAPTQTPIIAPPPPPATNTPVPPAPTQTPIIAPPPPPATNTPVPPAPTQTPIIAPPPPPATNTPVPPAPTQTPIIAPPATATPKLVLVPTEPSVPTETPVVIIAPPAPPAEGAPPFLPVTGVTSVTRWQGVLGWSLIALGTIALTLSALLKRRNLVR